MGLVAAGLGGGQVALLNLVPDQVDAALRGSALGLFNLLTFLGGALGVALAAAIADRLSWSAALAAIAGFPLIGCGLAAGSWLAGYGRRRPFTPDGASHTARRRQMDR